MEGLAAWMEDCTMRWSFLCWTRLAYSSPSNSSLIHWCWWWAFISSFCIRWRKKRSKKIKQNPKKYICAGRPWISRALQGIDIAFLRVYWFFEPVSLIKKSRGWGLWYLVPWTPRLLVALLFLPLNAHRKWKKKIKKGFFSLKFPARAKLPLHA